MLTIRSIGCVQVHIQRCSVLTVIFPTTKEFITETKFLQAFYSQLSHLTEDMCLNISIRGVKNMAN